MIEQKIAQEIVIGNDPDTCQQAVIIGCKGCSSWQPTPTEQAPQMPLIQMPLRCSRGKSCEYLCLDHCSICQFIKIDTTTHDQQVRKEFAEEVIKTMAVPVEGKRFQTQYNAWKQMVAHIRAMANTGGR